MKARSCILSVALALLAFTHPAPAQSNKFFRIAGPAATRIIAFHGDGTIVWSNALPGATYTVQTVSVLPGYTNWVSYVQLPTAGSINSNQIVDLQPPAGMAFIPSGVFTMGDTLDGETDAVPVSVEVTAIFMDTNLVTFSLWTNVFSYATNAGYVFDDAGAGKATNHPVQGVNWYDTLKWCNARSKKAGLTPVYYADGAMTIPYTAGDFSPYVNWTANGYRLPTEAEWEKSARGGLIGMRFPWGNTIGENQADYYGITFEYSYDLGPNGNNAAFATGAFPYTSPAGHFAANGYGLCDVAGNLQEWCWDWYGSTYAGGVNPTGPGSGSQRVVRGGYWDDDAYSARCAARASFSPSATNDITGFRCVKGF
jgi:formylglycine-generating enzyme required for sulfatase activity